MCCFSGKPGMVTKVANTRIFARLASPQLQIQYLVYQMVFAAKEPVAMILPLPVQQPASDHTCRFHNLKGDRDFFYRLSELFPTPRVLRNSDGAGRGGAGGFAGYQPLPVQEVGDFVASFVPTMRDFGRLNPRFVIPPSTWKQIPAYNDYGFAVFQLKAKPGSDTQPHPIALEFESRLHATLFFPTVHIHDGSVHRWDSFDHELYMQVAGNPSAMALMTKLPQLPLINSERKVGSVFLNASEAAKRIIAPDDIAYKCEMHGRFPNRDIILPLA